MTIFAQPSPKQRKLERFIRGTCFRRPQIFSLEILGFKVVLVLNFRCTWRSGSAVGTDREA